MLKAVQELVFEAYTKHTESPSSAFEELAAAVTEAVALRCAEIASNLEDDDYTAGAVWEAIRIEFKLGADEVTA